jgi:hypothetical protein
MVAVSYPEFKSGGPLMKSITWKDIVELIGVVAILFGLYFVYEEVRLIRTVARADLSAETNRNFFILDQLLLDTDLNEVYVKSLEEPGSLTRSERTQVNTILRSVLLQYERECYYYSIGIFEECESVPRDTALQYFGSKYGRAFWKTVRNRMVGPRISAVVDEVLSETVMDDIHMRIDESVLKNLADQ